MVYFKVPMGGRLYVSVVNTEDESQSCFRIHRSLCMLKATQVPTIKLSSFAQRISI